MSEPSVLLAEAAPAAASVRELQERIRQIQLQSVGAGAGATLATRSLQTQPAFAPLLPGGALKAGATYSVERSQALAMALMAGPSQAGAWCGVLGVPDFGAEAARAAGVELERLVLVPHPGDQWLAVASALIDVVGVLVTATPPRLPDAARSRFVARLRQREAMMIVLSVGGHETVAQSEATLRITESRWQGIGQGHGHLASRQVTVAAVAKGFNGQRRSARLWLPDVDAPVRAQTAEGVRAAQGELEHACAARDERSGAAA